MRLYEWFSNTVMLARGHSNIPWIFPFLRHMHNIAWFFLGSKNEIPNESGHGLSKCPYRFASSLSFVASRPYLSVWEHEIRRRELPLIFSRSLASTVLSNHQKCLIFLKFGIFHHFWPNKMNLFGNTVWSKKPRVMRLTIFKLRLLLDF